MLHPQLAVSPDQLVSLAVQVHRQGQLKEAETLYRRVLEELPRHVDALHFLGVLQHQLGRSAEAERFIRKALLENPRYVDARVNLGNVLKEQGRHADAEAEYRAAIQFDPDHANAHNNLGAALRAQRKLDAAIQAFRRATELAPEHADAFGNLGNALKANRQFEDALTAYRKAIEIDPRHCDAHLNLGRALYRFGRVEEARVVYAKWLEVDPDNPVAQHMHSACQGDSVPERCSDAFVEQSFDAFANSFDEVLQRLEYRAPALVAAVVDHRLSDRAAEGAEKLAVLDAGCGTGLCGAAMRPLARELVGIDLSTKMLEKAAATGQYDRLHQAELTQFLAAHPEQFDLIISADTLVYFGSLDLAVAAAAAALRPGGTLVFTLERSPADDPRDYTLHPHGRYSHREAYVRAVLAEVGLEAVSLEHEVLRMEIDQPVEGLVVVAERRRDALR